MEPRPPVSPELRQVRRTVRQRRLVLLAFLALGVVWLIVSFDRAEARNTRPEIVLAADSPVFAKVRDFLTVFASGSNEKYSRYLDAGLIGQQTGYYRQRMGYVKVLGTSPSIGGLATVSSLETRFAPGFTPPTSGSVREVPVLAAYTITVQAPPAKPGTAASGPTAISAHRYEDIFTVTYVKEVRGWRITDIRRVHEEAVETTPGK